MRRIASPISLYTGMLVGVALLFEGCQAEPGTGKADAPWRGTNVFLDNADHAGPVAFGAQELRAELTSRGAEVFTPVTKLLPPPDSLQISIAASREDSHKLAEAHHCADLPPDVPAESYSIRAVPGTPGSPAQWLVLAPDAVGAMYGTLDLAEAVRLGTLTSLKNSDHRPYVLHRGIKFNVPLDARTPSYSDAGDSAQANIAEMWSLDFWHEFIDTMARDRMDTLTLWNLHPFPSMVKVPEYPDVALNDVMRTTLPFDSTFNTQGHDMVRPAMLQHLETLKKMTIDEKIAFWRNVMDYAHDRGIDVYIFTWNVFTFGTDGKYGITTDQQNPITADYFRKSVREMFLTYPRLAGMGITAGENMRGDNTAKERWLADTYGQGMEDAKKIQPDRTMKLIHRMHQTLVPTLTDVWKDFKEPLDLEYKYSVAHMYSSPTPPFYKKDLVNIPAANPVWFTARNDDLYNYRWGDPDFARDYVKAIPGPEIREGLLIGSDGIIWGREITSTDPDSPRQLFIQKHWYSSMIWGRLAYEPALPNALFERTLDTRFPQTAPGELYGAFQCASRIVPEIDRFFWPADGIDLVWFPEACMCHPARFYTVKDFMNGTVMPESGDANIREYTAAIVAGKPSPGKSPLDVANALGNDAVQTLKELKELPKSPADKELRQTLGDLESMAHLGNYYANKIRGATELSLYNATKKAEHQQAAIQYLQLAVEDWKRYAAVAGRQYKPQLLTRVGYVDITALIPKVEADVDMARTWQLTP